MPPSQAAMQPGLFEDELLAFDDEPAQAVGFPGDGLDVFAADFGMGFFHVMRQGEDRCKRYKPAEFARLDFAPVGSVLIVENAHMQPQKRSLAQPFKFEQLQGIQQLAESKLMQVRLAPHSLTPKYRARYLGDDKGDEVDAKSLLLAFDDLGFSGLQRFNPRDTWPSRVLWAHEQIDDMNWVLNAVRQVKYCEEVSEGWKYFYRTGYHAAQIALMKKITYDKRLNTAYSWFFKESRDDPARLMPAFSLWSTVFDRHGQPRKLQGAAPGVNFIMNELLRQRPNHFRGGVGRSNLMHHLLKNRVIEELQTRKAYKDPETGKKGITPLHAYNSRQRQRFQEIKSEFRRAMKDALFAIKTVSVDGG